MKSLLSIMNGEGGNYVAPFLWLHNEDDSLIVNELHRIHDCGIGAVCVESRTHEEFCLSIGLTRRSLPIFPMLLSQTNANDIATRR